MTIKKFIETVLAGIKTADNLYRKWADQYFIDNGCEHFMVSMIALEIMKSLKKDKQKQYVFLEFGKKYIDTYHGEISYQKDIFTKRSKFDLAILNGRGQIKFILEAKCLYTGCPGFDDLIARDIKRLDFAYDNFSSSTSVFAMYLSTTKDTMKGCETCLNQKVTAIRERVRRNGYLLWKGEYFKEYTEANRKTSLSTCFCLVKKRN